MYKTFCVLACVLLSSFSYAESAFDIVQKSDQAMRGKSSYSEATMKIVRPDWSRSMTMKSWTKGTELSLVLVTAPAKDKGSRFHHRCGLGREKSKRTRKGNPVGAFG